MSLQILFLTKVIPKGTERLLVVEDDASVRQFLTSMLVKAGCNVQTAQDGEEALALCGENRFDLVISDIIMPRMNGIDMYRKLAAEGKKIKILFMTGYAADLLPEETLSQDNVEFTEKPVSPKTLLPMVRQLLDQG